MGSGPSAAAFIGEPGVEAVAVDAAGFRAGVDAFAATSAFRLAAAASSAGTSSQPHTRAIAASVRRQGRTLGLEGGTVMPAIIPSSPPCDVVGRPSSCAEDAEAESEQGAPSSDASVLLACWRCRLLIPCRRHAAKVAAAGPRGEGCSTVLLAGVVVVASASAASVAARGVEPEQAGVACV